MKDKQLSLRQRLDAIAAEGREIKVTWEGGNDSGGYDLYVDGEQGNHGDLLADNVIDIIANTIDYGSWAGDYFADGAVYYNKDEGAFIGEGKDTTSDGGCLVDISIEVKVPKLLNFDFFNITTEGTFCWGEFTASARFVIDNGPVFPEHSKVEEDMENYIRESVSHLLETDEACKNEEIGWVYNDWMIARDDFEEDGDSLVFIIDSIDFTYNNTEYQPYHITINEEQ
jgi:hypothetical protein